MMSFFSFAQPVQYLILNGNETVLINNSNNINNATLANRTVEFWFNADDIDTDTKQVIYEEGGTTRGINFWINDDHLYLGIFNKAEDETGNVKWYGTWFKSISLKSNEWYHVALVLKDGNSNPILAPNALSYYLNGSLQNQSEGGKLYPHGADIRLSSNETSVFPKESVWATNTNGGIFNADSRGIESVNGTFFKGKIGLFRIWNSARTDVEIVENNNELLKLGDANAPDLVAYLNGSHFYYLDNSGNEKPTEHGGTPEPSNYIWSGANNASWDNPSNWNHNVVPQDGVDIEINTDISGSDPILENGTLELKSVVINSANIVNVNNTTINITAGVINKGTIVFDDLSIVNIAENLENNGVIEFKKGSRIRAYGDIINNLTIKAIEGSSIESERFINNLAGKVELMNNDDNTVFIRSEFSNKGELVINDDVSFRVGADNKHFTNRGIFTLNNKTSITTYGDFTFDTNAELLPLDKDNRISVKGNFNLLQGNITIDNSSIKIDGILNNNGNITIKSNNKKTGSLIAKSGITGNPFTVERYIHISTNSTRFNRWHFTSSPVKNEVSDVFLSHYFYSFDQNSNSYVRVSENETLEPGKGYATRMKDTGANPIIFNKVPNSVSINQNLISQGAGNNDSWNLVGNPFTSSINLDNVLVDNKDNIEPYFYILTSNGSWGIYPAPDNSTTYRNMPMGQAFFVHATNNVDFNFNSSQQTDARRNYFYKKSLYEYFEKMFVLSAKVDTIVDNAYYVTNDNATANFDGNYDAYKFMSWGDTPNVFFYVDNKLATISHEPTAELTQVGFQMSTNANNVELSLSEFRGYESIVLEDKKERKTINLKDSNYIFDYNVQDDVNRFAIHFTEQTLGDKEIAPSKIKIYSIGNIIHINTTKQLENVKISIFDTLGKQVFFEEKTDNNEINTGLKPGVYIVVIEHKIGVERKKIIIN